MPYVYILECADGSYYTGSTWDLERRLWEHNNGLGAKHTAKRLPVKLVFCEACDRVEDAYMREKQIQGWSRKKKEALMAGGWERVHSFAECQNASHSRNVGFSPRLPVRLRSRQGSGNAAQPTLLESDTSINTDNALNPPGSRSMPVTGTEIEQGLAGCARVEVRVLLSSKGVDVGRALSGAEVGRALSGVEGNAGHTTESPNGYTQHQPDTEHQANGKPARIEKRHGC